LEGIFGRTLGKLITGTIVVDSKTLKKASFRKILGRTFSRLIPFESLSFLFSVYPKGWHDSIPNTMVINMKGYKAFKQFTDNKKLY
jgi:uncharacterized RDD family membrane protein YckC